jgi:hypothetical protein
LRPIKLEYDRVEELYRIYKNRIAVFEAEEHNPLLLAHIHEFAHRLKVMVVKEATSYTIGFTESEMIAFQMTWDKMPYNPTHWSCQIVKSMSDKMNKRFHELKRTKLLSTN